MFMKYDSPFITAWTVVVGFFSHQDHELPKRLLLRGLWPSQKSTSFGKFSFVILQPFSFKHSLDISLVNSQFLAFFFFKEDSIIVQGRIDKLLPLPLGEIHCRPSACKLFSCDPSVLQVLKNLVKLCIWKLPTAWRVWQWNCAKRVIN